MKNIYINEPFQPINPIKDFLAGGIGAICLVFVGHPADTIKVRLQTMNTLNSGQSPIYNNIMDCLLKTVQKEGVFALYKGIGSVLVGAIPISSLSLLGYSIGKQMQSPLNLDRSYSLIQLFYAGALAGLINSFVLTPVDRVKCLLQIQRTARYKGSFDCAEQLLKQEGFRSLYRGFSITVFRGIPSWGIYFCTYEELKRMFTSKKSGRRDLNTWQTIVAGGTAGLVSWMVAMPVDVLKSRLQSAPSDRYPGGVRDVLDQLLRQDGVRGFYRGFSAILLRAFPANAAFFLGYEATIDVLNSLF